MSLGSIRNRYCPCNSGKKYKNCHFDEDYWKGFNTIVNKIDVKENLHGKPVEYQKVITTHFKNGPL